MIKTALIVILIVYGIPTLALRKGFRSIVYRRNDWKIHILPWFVKETHALFTNKYFKSGKEIRIANKYRVYLLVYILLIVLYFLV